MIWVEHFTALIQLISAVNFVNIATHFPNRVHELIFDEGRLLKNKFGNFTNEIAADLQSLESMSPIKNAKGETNEVLIKNCQNQYKELNKQWQEKQNIIVSEINSAKNVKGSKSLFLYVSLFCVMSLFHISLLSIFKCNFLLLYILMFNVIVLGYSIYLSYVVWKHKWDGKSDVVCYRSTSWNFVVTIVLSLLISGILCSVASANGGLQVPSLVSTIIISICIGLPFYPCLLSVLFILCHEEKIKKMIENETHCLKLTQGKLHKCKIDLDRVEEMFTIPNWSDFRY